MTQTQKKQIILMYGGRSGEHEISLLSAASVLNALDKDIYDIQCIAGNKKGQWFSTDSREFISPNPSLPLPIKNAQSKEIFLSTEHFKNAYAVLPIMHGPLFEDGRLQGFLDLCDVAYVGSGHLSSAMAMDKEVAKVIALNHDVNIAPYQIIKSSMSESKRLEIMNETIRDFGFPLFVKPACMGSSVGINKAQNQKELSSAIEDALHYDHKILIEKSINGREIEVAILKEQHTIKVSQAGEIRIKSQDDFYSYQAKYKDKDKAELIFPAPLSNTQLQAIQNAAKTTFAALECEGLARVDFFLEDNSDKIILNEVNTLPGFTKISMYPKLWQISGVEYSNLLNKLIEQAHWRRDQNNSLLRNYL